ncbi:MAG: ribosome recycling factor [Bacteroides sp.]|nr:MAG: ribosome recycling factor [Bacteroides sp.]
MENLINNYINSFKTSSYEIISNFKNKISHIQSNRIDNSIFDIIKINYYNDLISINNISTINIINNSLIVIEPWENKFIKDIETAILNSDLGFSPKNDGKQITIKIPFLTHEKRDKLALKVKKITEIIKIQIRNLRSYYNNKIKKLLKDNISKDDIKKGENLLHDKYVECINLISKIMKNKIENILKI